ncbi:uncharacterized protein BYT42DRAFT_607022 [Radiomyces spectabilis]|uniref:uncharacterized protein n=1 Tax=Radiomyces spectabilis TaxID=64574 RepID=UPI002220E538|nr:uncharacterized protein BYT42DRAFT_607022 [Radiomyces spectabilis]KAI8371336.1 hypothetical protein BYT42DRAFT_607022 [Radiomyces spectabilis]
MTCNCGITGYFAKGFCSGYIMCYICRKNIAQAYCNHCNKCHVWEAGAEEAIAKSAEEKARRQYLEAHPELQYAQDDQPEDVENFQVNIREKFIRTRTFVLQCLLNQLV